MHAPVNRLYVPPAEMLRDADQRASFGQYCLNAASYPLPAQIDQRRSGDYRIYATRRRFYGIPSPVTSALIERGSRTSGPLDLVATAAAALDALEGGDPGLDIVKLFVAGVPAERSSSIQMISGPAGTLYYAAFFPCDAAEVIELPHTYEEFLATLGNHTRRDMRKLRRRNQTQGYVFDFSAATAAGLKERQALGRFGHPEPYAARHIAAYDTFLAAQKDSFHANLRSAGGDLLSCCAGFVSDGAAVVLYQLNHRNYPKAWLSLSNRSYTIERLIKDGVREFILPGGGSGLLAKACRMRQSGELVLIRRSPAAFIKAFAISVLRSESSVSLAIRRLLRT